MKIAFGAVWIACLLAIVLPQPAHAVVQETLKLDYYPVTLNSGDLGTALTKAYKWKKGDDPSAQSSTATRVNWVYHVSAAGNGYCQISAVTTQLGITMLLPRLVSSPHYQSEFDARLAKLRKHEDGHADVGREIAREIDQALTSMEKDHCSVIAMNANNRAHNIARNLLAKEREYEKITNHGATQDAWHGH